HSTCPGRSLLGTRRGGAGTHRSAYGRTYTLLRRLYWDRCASGCPHHERWTRWANPALANDPQSHGTPPASGHVSTRPGGASPQRPTTFQSPLSTEYRRLACRFSAVEDPR